MIEEREIELSYSKTRGCGSEKKNNKTYAKGKILYVEVVVCSIAAGLQVCR